MPQRLRGNAAVRRVSRFGCFLAILALYPFAPTALARPTDFLARQLADKRVDIEENNFLRRAERIDADDYQRRNSQINAEIQNIRTLIAKMPREIQTGILQQSESIFQTRIVPLREQWQQELVEKQRAAQARDAQIRNEMSADADRAGKLQASRVILAEKYKRGEISQAEFSRDDKTAENEVLALQRKYDGYGATWGPAFSRSVAQVVPKATGELRLKERTEETRSEIGQDAHRAAELTLSMRRNDVFRARRVISPQEASTQNASLQAQLAPIQAKYATGATAADFRDRVTRLVQAGLDHQKTQWDNEAGRAARPVGARVDSPIPGPALAAGSRPATVGDPVLAGNPANAPAWVKEFPDPARVLGEIHGSDQLDTAARQAAALSRLSDVVVTLGGSSALRSTPEERQLRDRYVRAEAQVCAAAYRILDPTNTQALEKDSPRGKWLRLRASYWVNEAFTGDLLQRYLSPESRQSYLKLVQNRSKPATRPRLASPTSPPSGTGSSLGWLAVLLLVLVLAGVAGYLLYGGRRTARSPGYADLKDRPPSPALVADRPALAESQPGTPTAAPVSPAGGSGGHKESLFTEQKAKYQARYTDAVDQMTGALQELGQLTALVEGAQSNLRSLGKVLQDRVKALMIAQYANPREVLLNAAIFMPFYRLFRRAGGLLKLIMVVVALSTAGGAAGQLLQGQFVGIAAFYLILATLFVFVEREFRLKGPLGLLRKSAGELKSLSLTYVYEDQIAPVPGAAPCHGIRVSSAGKKGLAVEVTLAASGADSDPAPGRWFLTMGNMGAYRIGIDGRTALVSVNPASKFMQNHGSLLTQALGEQKDFASTTLPLLADYGRVVWRRRRASEEVAQLQRLVEDVQRVEGFWHDIHVDDKVFDFLLRRIDLFNMRDPATPAGILLLGYPGNGKTLLARKIAESVSSRFESIDLATLRSAEDVKQHWEKSRGKDPVVLFVEYGERAFPRPRSENEGSGSREITLAWLAEWAKVDPCHSHVWTIMSAQSEQELHPALVAQFGGSKIEVASPNPAGRELILRKALRENHLAGDLPDWVVAATGGATIRDLREIIKETKLQSVPNAPMDSHWREAVKSVRGADSAFRDDSKTWDHLVLPPDVKEQLQRACRVLREADRYKARGVNVPNILLFGPPGTGKTEVARTFANESGVKFVMATTADLKAEYVGQSAHRVRDVFAKARGCAPAVLLIDEMETVAAKRGSGLGDSFTQEIVTEMLQEMDGARKSDRPVFLLGATNRPEDIDPAILSRFTSKIEIPLPDETGRREMLMRFISERTVDPGLDVEEISRLLAKRLGRKSGRDLQMLVNRAMERATLMADSPEDVWLTREALLTEVAPAGREVSEVDLQRVWAQIVLKPALKESLLSKIRLFNSADKAAPRGLLLYGPPGTGKTEIARRIAESSSSYFLPLTGSDLKAGYTGQSGQQVKAVWDKARAHGRCVMFVDECEGVFGRRGGVNTDSFSEELVREFLAMWDGVASEGQVWVVGATNRRDQLDEAIVSRFGAAVEIGLPEAAERLEILRLEMRKLERDAEIDEFVGRATTGLAGRDLSQIARDVCAMAAESKSPITAEMWREVIARYMKAGSESVDEGARWESLVLSEETLKTLKMVCESLRQIETLQKQGLEPPRGALIFGPPGTGKTQIAKTLANECGLAFIAAGLTDLKAGYIGQSGQKTRELFDRARGKAPCILFIDEIDGAAAARGSENADQYSDDIVNEMLRQMDGVRKTGRHVFVLGATNYPERVDKAILSRFTYKIEIPNPDPEQRRRLFRTFLREQPSVDFDVDEIATELAKGSGDVGGRDILNLVRAASARAMERAFQAGTPDRIVLSREDLLGQLKPIGKEVTEEDLQKVWSRIVLKHEIKESILSKIRLFNSADKAAPRGLLLYGPPGTGKTEIARRIAESSGGFFMSLTGSDLKAAHVGQSGQYVKSVWEKARARGRCIMFVDECEGIFARRGSVDTDSASEELVREFLAMWDGVGTKGQVWVVGATNRRDQLDEAIVSRFGAAVEIGLPEAPERLEILRMEMRKLERDTEIPESVARKTTGFAGRDLATVARDVCALAAERGGAVTVGLWDTTIARYAKASSEAVDESARWDALILAEDTLRRLKTTCDTLRHLEVLKKQGLDVPGATLLYGPSGTGKTQIARTLANECGLPFLAAGTADLKAGFLGQAGQRVRELFERARGRAPCVLFVDEIDAVVPNRAGPHADQLTNEMVTQFLHELDGVRASERHVYLLAATNLPERIDPAIRSRFEEEIEIPNPDAAQRQRLFRLFLRKQKTEFQVDELATELAGRSGDISGRDIRGIVKNATQRAIRRALDASRPDQVVLSREDFLPEVSESPSRPSVLESLGPEIISPPEGRGRLEQS